MSRCFDCPRRCGADREAGDTGFCRSPYLPVIARAALHIGEEPCISGTRGSGTVFFTGCSLGCVYCQNAEISRGGAGTAVTVPKLRDIFLRLRDQGAHNLNLVTANHFVRPVAEALSGLDLGIPVCWNSSGYETADSLKRLEGLVQIYMPDFKYSSSEAAMKYSGAADYPETAAAAIDEMFRQVGPYRIDDDGILISGVLIRHLILPALSENTIGVIDRVAARFPAGEILFSLMSQYTPMPEASEKFPELSHTVSQSTAKRLYLYMVDSGITEGYWQDAGAVGREMIPEFDGTGVCNI
ncbi:MAG: radical SAM protein [Clostridia bacterium]|nr:radical SAM protein [Clostridia bacterium]